MAVGIVHEAFVEEHAPVGTFATRDEENQVVALGKRRDGRHSVGHLSADGVETAERGLGMDVVLDKLHDFVEFVEVFRGLRIEVDVA